jgi:predicted nucleic acid-binding protein
VKFVDTSWWVAWTLPEDTRHGQAMNMAARVGDSERLLTTNLVLGETWTFLRSKDGHRASIDFIDRVADLEAAGRFIVHSVTGEKESRAWRWLRRHDERVYSFVDATSFEVMRARRLREALAFDNDFAAAGFIELRPGG